MKLKKYSYIFSFATSYSFLGMLFFNETEDIQTNEDSQDLTYTSKEERLFAEEKNWEKSILKGPCQKRINGIQSIIKAFSYVKTFREPIWGIYVTLIERKIVSIIGLFVEGFPVFSNDLKRPSGYSHHEQRWCCAKRNH